jgi:flagellar basal-body rod protein FlgF
VADAMVVAIHSMQNNLLQIEAVSRNMANVSTPGFKRDVALLRPFESALLAATPAAELAGDQLPVVETRLDAGAGAVRLTGKPLDVSVQGDAYLEVQSLGSVAYMRTGSLRLDGSGRLVTDAGLAVSGVNGEIRVSGNALIAPNGDVSQDGKVAGRLKLVSIESKGGMERRADGLYQPRDAQAVLKEGRATVRSGHLEASNVQPFKEMLTMMGAMRQFEAAQKLYQGYDEAMRGAVNKLSGQ